MANKAIQEQRQEQRQTQRQTLSQQQWMVARLLELPLAQLQERVAAEMDDNPALEGESATDAMSERDDETTDYGGDDETSREMEERASALEEALSRLGGDDELPVYQPETVRTESTASEAQTFYDELREQVSMLDLGEQEREVMDYIVGSLDDDGLLRKPLDSIADELAIYHGIDVDAAEVERLLKELQGLDPAGIGGRDLRECLLLQLERKEPSRLRQRMQEVLERHFDDFKQKHWQKIAREMGMGESEAADVFGELRRLNPRPGASMGETVGRSMQQITPDFIVETSVDGDVTFALNNGDLPRLHVSESFEETVRRLQGAGGSTRERKEALAYARSKVEAARGFIEAVRMRRLTLTLTMQAIIDLQHDFFVDGDEASLRPMILKDIEARTGLDKSTISRVSNSKWVQTRWGMFPLRFFFSEHFMGEHGEEQSGRQIKLALRDIIDHENKKSPLSDAELAKRLGERGYQVARRTVAKYREQLGIPVARLRGEITGDNGR